MQDPSFWQILLLLLEATQWTLALTAAAFLGGGLVGAFITLLRVAPNSVLNGVAIVYVQVLQGTPLLMQLFLAFFGLPLLLGIDVTPWSAAVIALTGFSSAFLADIWRGAIQAIPRGQWEAAYALGLRFPAALARIIAPQATRLAIPPTVGFGVQVVKGTALASIIGFIELTKAGVVLNNITFEPLLVFTLVALIYFIINFPLSWLSRKLEHRLVAISERP